jgi:hypothetical protein
MKLPTKDIRTLSAFKLFYVAGFCFFLPICIILGLIGASGGDAVYANGQPVYGGAAVVTALLLSVIMPLVISIALTLGFALLKLIGGRLEILKVRASAGETS